MTFDLTSGIVCGFEELFFAVVIGIAPVQMEINVETVDNIKVIELAGELDSSTARAAEDTIIPLADNFDRILLDMSRVTYMSSAGLRMLLLIYRRISSKPGNVILVGLNDDVKDVMAITGFLDFFTIYDTRSAGIDALH